MKKQSFIIIAILICGLTMPLHSISQTPDWTRLLQLNTDGLPNVRVVSADANNVYLATKISAPFTFEGINYSPVGNADLFIVKSNNAGTTQWVKQINAQAGGLVNTDAIKIDASGNIFLAGTFTGTLTIGTSTITSDPSYNAFMAKFDISGNGLWACPFQYSGSGSSKIVVDILAIPIYSVIVAD